MRNKEKFSEMEMEITGEEKEERRNIQYSLANIRMIRLWEDKIRQANIYL